MSSVDPTLYNTSSIIKSESAHYIIFGFSIFSIAWGVFNANKVMKIKLEVDKVKVNEHVEEPNEANLPTTKQGCYD